jgi:hypothetical protein
VTYLPTLRRGLQSRSPLASCPLPKSASSLHPLREHVPLARSHGTCEQYSNEAKRGTASLETCSDYTILESTCGIEFAKFKTYVDDHPSMVT